MALIMGALASWFVAAAFVYGAAIGLLMTILTRRSTDKALLAAVENPRHGVVVIFSGFVLRYATAILGLLAGFKILGLSAEPVIAGFVLMIIVQVLTSFLVKPLNNKREA